MISSHCFKRRTQFTTTRIRTTPPKKHNPKHKIIQFFIRFFHILQHTHQKRVHSWEHNNKKLPETMDVEDETRTTGEENRGIGDEGAGEGDVGGVEGTAGGVEGDEEETGDGENGAVVGSDEGGGGGGSGGDVGGSGGGGRGNSKISKTFEYPLSLPPPKNILF
jgi:hypothetical protein